MDVPELVSIDEYDSKKSKLEGSVRWLVARAYYNEQVPPPYRKPFTEDSQGDKQLSPSVVQGLTSGDLYCKACGNIYTAERTMNWQGHSPVFQALARKGVYVLDVRKSVVTEGSLTQDKPINLGAHVDLISSLQAAYTAKVASVERISKAVRKFTTFSASSELPSGPEDALVFWLNKVGSVTQQRLDKQFAESQESNQQQQQRRLPVNKQHSVEPPTVPILKDLCEDLSNGALLAVLISFYCSDAIKLHDIALKEALGIADSLYNIQLVTEFCEKIKPSCPLHLTLNDLFYTRRDLVPDILAFLAELFYLFELHPIDQVKDVQATSKRPLTAQTIKSAQALISPATRRSTQQGDRSSSSPDLNSPSQLNPAPRQPLLPKRLQQQQPRRGSLNHTPVHEGGDVAEDWDEDHVEAWADTPDGRRIAPVHRRDASGDMLANVSMDSEMSIDVSSEGSINIDAVDADPPRRGPGPRGVGPAPGRSAIMDINHPDYMEVESLGSNTTRTTRGLDSARSGAGAGGVVGEGDGDEGDAAEVDSIASPSERLIPAQLRPAKEKSNKHHTKEVESGEKYEKSSPGSGSNATTPNRLHAPHPRSLNVQHSEGGSAYTAQNMGGGSSSDSTPSEDYKTPSVETAPGGAFGSQLSQPAEGEPDGDTAMSAFSPVSTNPSRAKSPPSSRSQSAVQRSSAFDRSKPAMQSFTLHDRHTPQTARAAGIPIIGGENNSGHSTPVQQILRGGADARDRESSPRSSSEGSDQELRKLNSDYKHKERATNNANAKTNSNDTRGSFFLNDNTNDTDSNASAGSSETPQRPASLHVPKPIKVDAHKSRKTTKQSPVTSFASLRHQRENGEVAAAFAGGASGGDGAISGGGRLTSQFQQRAKSAGPETKPVKRTTFGTMPNKTTWQDCAQQKATVAHPNNNGRGGDAEADTVHPLSSDLDALRMRLQEKRNKIQDNYKEMEKQRAEKQQDVGKQAFLQAVKKNKDPAAKIDSNKENKQSPSKQKPQPISTQRIGSGHAKSPVTPQRSLHSNQHEQPLESQRRSATDLTDLDYDNRPPIGMQKSRSGYDQRITDSPIHPRTPKSEHNTPSHTHPNSSMSRSYDDAGYELSRERSPTPEFSETGIVPMHHTPKPFSRKDIQETIDNVKQRQITAPQPRPGDVTFQKAKPMQSSIEELEAFTRLQEEVERRELELREREQQQQQQLQQRTDSPPRIPATSQHAPSKAVSSPVHIASHPPQQASALMNTSVEKVKNEEGHSANSSLEKLNMSLSDLRGEIQRLSLQRDEIKRPVAAPVATAPGTAFYPYTQAQDSMAGTMNQPAAFTQPHHPSFPQTAHPQPTYPYPPPPQQGYPGQYPPPPHGAQFYPPNQYQTSPHSIYQGQQPPPQQLGYPYPNSQAPPQWAQQQHPSMQGNMQYPAVSTFAPQYTNTAPSTLHNSIPMAAPLMSPTEGGGRPLGKPSEGIPVGSPSPTKKLLSDSLNESPQKNGSRESLRDRSLSPEKKLTTSITGNGDNNLGEGDDDNDDEDDDTQQTDEQQQQRVSQPSEAEKEPFFVSFDDMGPAKRSKPQLGKFRGAKKESSKEKKETEAAEDAADTAGATGGPRIPKKAPPPLPEEILHPKVVPVLEPGVAFTFGDEEPPLTEMEIKKKKLEAQIAKRRQKEEEKRMKTEMKRAKQREEEQQKKDLIDAKKAEDAAKREHILEQYRKKKQEEANQESGEAPPKNTPKKREKKPMKPRPVSQPPPHPSLLDDYGAGGSSASSQEDLRGGMAGLHRGLGGGGGGKHALLPSHHHPSHFTGVPSPNSPSSVVYHPPPVSSPSSAVHHSPYASPYAAASSSSRPGSAIDFHRPSPTRGGSDVTDYSNFAYGGATHRRPPSPEKAFRGDGTEEYNGPKLFKKPSSKSNRSVIHNALKDRCLAGTVNDNVRRGVFDDLQNSDANHFVILFRNSQQQYRGLYSYYPETELIRKVSGHGPKDITEKMLDKFYKYNSGAKQFSCVDTTKHMSATIDAITLQSSVWEKKKPASKKPTPQKMY